MLLLVQLWCWYNCLGPFSSGAMVPFLPHESRVQTKPHGTFRSQIHIPVAQPGLVFKQGNCIRWNNQGKQHKSSWCHVTFTCLATSQCSIISKKIYTEHAQVLQWLWPDLPGTMIWAELQAWENTAFGTSFFLSFLVITFSPPPPHFSPFPSLVYKHVLLISILKCLVYMLGTRMQKYVLWYCLLGADQTDLKGSP